MIKKIWPNSTVFIIGGGPSIVGQDLCLPPRGGEYGLEAYLQKQHVLGVNNALYLGDFVDVLFFGDAKWYWWNREAVQAFPGPKYTLNKGTKYGHKSVENEKGIVTLTKRRHKGLFLKDEGGLAWNRSSGAAAVNVAIHLGAKRIVLLGFDMRNVDGQKNFLRHDQENTKPNPYINFIEGFRWIAKAAQKTGIKIWNATPGSVLPYFERFRLEDLI
jgi:hypothetical protein